MPFVNKLSSSLPMHLVARFLIIVGSLLFFVEILMRIHRDLWSSFGRVLYCYPSVHGAVFEKSEILRCGLVRFSDIVHPRCGSVL